MSHRVVALLRRVLRSSVTVLAGYVSLIIGTTLVQETLLGGVSYQASSLTILILAGLLTPLAGIAAGAVSGWLAAARPVLHVVPIAIAIGIETTALYRSGRVDGPLWFEALAAAALMAGVLVGAMLAGKRAGAGSDPVDA